MFSTRGLSLRPLILLKFQSHKPLGQSKFRSPCVLSDNNGNPMCPCQLLRPASCVARAVFVVKDWRPSVFPGPCPVRWPGKSSRMKNQRDMMPLIPRLSQRSLWSTSPTPLTQQTLPGCMPWKMSLLSLLGVHNYSSQPVQFHSGLSVHFNPGPPGGAF